MKSLGHGTGCAPWPLSRVVTILCCLHLILTPVPALAFRLLIDSGHDRQSPSVKGCRSGIPEYVFNDTLVGMLRDKLQTGTDVSVAVTREAQDCISLRGRARMTSGFDLMLSIHHDSAQDVYLQPVMCGGKEKRCVVGPEGFCVYVSRKNPYPEASILFARLVSGFMIKHGLSPSTHHGEDIPGERHIMIAPGVYYYDNLIVLKEGRCPAVLVEAAVLTNPDDEATASTPEFQHKVTEALRDAVTTYAGMVTPMNPEPIIHAAQPVMSSRCIVGDTRPQEASEGFKTPM